MHFGPCKKRRACRILQFKGNSLTPTKAAPLTQRDFLDLAWNSCRDLCSQCIRFPFPAPEHSQVGAGTASPPVQQSCLLTKPLRRGLPNNRKESSLSWAWIAEKRNTRYFKVPKSRGILAARCPFLPEPKSCREQRRQPAKTQTHHTE